MPRTGPSWTYTETDLLLENIDMPVADLCALFPGRTQKSIERKIEKLRKVGKVGYKYRAYESRKPGSGWSEPWED